AARGDAALEIEDEEVGLPNEVDELRREERASGLRPQPLRDPAPEHRVAAERELHGSRRRSSSAGINTSIPRSRGQTRSLAGGPPGAGESGSARSPRPSHQYRETVRIVLDCGWKMRGHRRKLVRVVIGHAVEFETWRSLAPPRTRRPRSSRDHGSPRSQRGSVMRQRKAEGYFPSAGRRPFLGRRDRMAYRRVLAEPGHRDHRRRPRRRAHRWRAIRRGPAVNAARTSEESSGRLVASRCVSGYVATPTL